MNKIKERAAQRYLALLAGILIVLTASVLYLSFVEPNEPGLTPELRWYSNVIGSILGWLWLSVGVLLYAFADSDFRPSVPGMFLAAGVGLLLTFNGAFVGGALASFALRLTGNVILAGLATWSGYALLTSPWANFKTIE
ncbi:hypothetical protein [Halococcus saccharolyticus]|uniref:Uncharacterized protein n=1 Tax=Halococcus saccharolyticus DSM 5350 TaxID=1227455 RepID=M0MT29_9EURY|nr:hypothetical protein [Halococcus saccharolyticus]EMA47610.1 hypothetical protein C449_01067 [Halococcus saccharolyticus DSM 5350]